MLGFLLLVGGLATGVYAAANSPLTPEESQDQDLGGPRVAWLGEITGVLRDADETCFVLNRAQDTGAGFYARTSTRFVACNPGTFDGASFVPGRVLLVEGNLGPSILRLIGGQELTANLVAAPTLTAQPDLPDQGYPPGYAYPYPAYDPWYPRLGIGIGLGYHHWRR